MESRDDTTGTFSGSPGTSVLPIHVHAPEDTVLRCDGSSGDLALERRFAAQMAGAFKIFKERHAKYGPTNIARRGPVGVLVRLDDKLARLDQLVMNGKGLAVTDETLADTCSDIANYALILLLCKAGQWPGWPHP